MLLRFLLLGIVLILAGLLLWQLPSVLEHQSLLHSSEKFQRLPCLDPIQSCGDEITQIHFSAIPQPLRPFQLTIRHPQASNISVEMNMQGMEMGLNRYRLLAQDGIWFADIILPACLQGRSDWEMIIRIEDGSGGSVKKINFQAQAK